MKWNPDGNLSPGGTSPNDANDANDVTFSDPSDENAEDKDENILEGSQKGISLTSLTSSRGEDSGSDNQRPKGIYKASWMGDVWACRYCGLNGNKSSMWKHDCPEIKESQS
jgi:hypothetical protein